MTIMERARTKESGRSAPGALSSVTKRKCTRRPHCPCVYTRKRKCPIGSLCRKKKSAVSFFFFRCCFGVCVLRGGMQIWRRLGKISGDFPLGVFFALIVLFVGFRVRFLIVACLVVRMWWLESAVLKWIFFFGLFVLTAIVVLIETMKCRLMNYLKTMISFKFWFIETNTQFIVNHHHHTPACLKQLLLNSFHFFLIRLLRLLDLRFLSVLQIPL